MWRSMRTPSVSTPCSSWKALVGDKLDRPAEIGRREGVVDQERNPSVVRDLRDAWNIQHFEAGIADGLADDQARIGLNGRAKGVQRARLDKSRGDAETRQRMRQEIDAAAIEP